MCCKYWVGTHSVATAWRRRPCWWRPRRPAARSAGWTRSGCGSAWRTWRPTAPRPCPAQRWRLEQYKSLLAISLRPKIPERKTLQSARCCSLINLRKLLILVRKTKIVYLGNISSHNYWKDNIVMKTVGYGCIWWWIWLSGCFSPSYCRRT